MTTRSVLGLLYTAKAYREQGHPIDDLMRSHGFPMDTLDATARIERAKELQILDDIFALNPNPNLGLTIGSQMGLAGYGPLSMLLMTSKNAYEACQIGVRYQALAYLFGDIRLELDGDVSSLLIDPMFIPPHLTRFLMCRDMAGTYRFFRDIFQMNERSIKLSEVHFSLDAPDSIQVYEKTFDCPVLFNQPHNRLLLKSHYLKTPFEQANQNAFDMYRAQCDKMLLEAGNINDSLSAALGRYLSMFNYEIPNVVEAAGTFGMSERTFRRQLKQEEQSYQKVLDRVRFEKAKDWLSHSKLPIEDIASKLGYQEAAAFNHAFKRWSEMTPSQFRKQVHT